MKGGGRDLFSPAGPAAPGRGGGRRGGGERRRGRRGGGAGGGGGATARAARAPGGGPATRCVGGGGESGTGTVSRRAGGVRWVVGGGSRLSAYIGATVGEIGFLRGFWMDGSRRLAWLEDYAASFVAAADLAAPAAVTRGIRLDQVSFAYPGTTRLVL